MSALRRLCPAGPCSLAVVSAEIGADLPSLVLSCCITFFLDLGFFSSCLVALLSPFVYFCVKLSGTFQRRCRPCRQFPRFMCARIFRLHSSVLLRAPGSRWWYYRCGSFNISTHLQLAACSITV